MYLYTWFNSASETEKFEANMSDIQSLVREIEKLRLERKDRIEASISRFQAVERFEEPDAIPTHIGVGGVWSNWYLRKYGIKIRKFWEDPETQLSAQLRSLIDSFKEFDDDRTLDSVAVLAGVVTEPSVVGCKVVYPEDDWPWVDLRYPPLNTPEKIDDFETPDIQNAELIKSVTSTYEYMEKMVGDSFRIGLGNGEGPFELAVYARGITDIIRDMFTDPPLVHKLLKKMSDVWIKIYRYYEKLLGKDMCPKNMSENPLGYFSPKQFREFIFPQTKYIVEKIGGDPWLYYNYQGEDIHVFIEDIAKLPKLSSCYVSGRADIKKCKEALSRKGVISSFHFEAHDLYVPSPEQIEETCREMIPIIAPGGGSSLNTGIVDSKVPKENLQAFIKATKKYGKYPKKMA